MPVEGRGLGEVATPQEAAAFFARFPTVVLVANSDAVDIARLKSDHGEDALFVFFNKVYKVLSRPFEGKAMLVARSSPAGANIVYRREVPEVLALFEGPRFQGILNLKAGAREAFSTAEAFGFARVGHLDLTPSVDGFYPATHVPTSGFALALFLAENCPATQVVLAGFTARRSARWKLFADHDWTFEQIVLRLLFRSGRLGVAAGSPGGGEGALSVIAARLPGVTPNEVALVAGEVLSERLESAHSGIDSLMKVTRLQQRLDGFVRSLKPRTRKQRLAEKQAAERP